MVLAYPVLRTVLNVVDLFVVNASMDIILDQVEVVFQTAFYPAILAQITDHRFVQVASMGQH